ncbi:LysR family transcriptional regulator [Corallococcus sp. CA047B]|uniref:LysR family transcriptional regulator n=1 Tax=Corallococcus sp. CA047B TaxID=2316729 RepID=UPI000EA17DE3|nr:LysR family transcriptional regulator [Corallococcus sp. CA047B]RKH08810.1 LysR family transcriptional regulator [Corallococcus sp. CA047B]
MAVTPLNALHQFLTVARLRGFAPAAAELGVSASALSQTVRQLEERLGVSLLSRTTRSVAVTAAGRKLMEQAGPGVAQALGALKDASARPGEVTGTLRLTLPSSALPFLLAPLVPSFCQRYPKVELDLVVDNRKADIVAEGFDAGVRMEEYLERDMVAVRMSGPFRFVVVASPAYLKRHGTPRKPKDLLLHNCFAYRSSNTGALLPWDLEKGSRTWRLPVRGAVTTNDERVWVGLAEAGLGLCYVPESQVAMQLKEGTLRLVLEEYAASVPGLFLYFPSRAQVSPALRAFLEHAREVMGPPARTRAKER